LKNDDTQPVLKKFQKRAVHKLMTSESKPKSRKTSYSIQVVIILSIFFFVLFNLVFKLIIDLRSDAIRKKAELAEKQRLEEEFVANIDSRYSQLITQYKAKEFEKAIEIIKEFNQYGKADYKDLESIKKEIRLHTLKKKLEVIPKIQLNEFMQLSEDIDIEEDDSTEVFIRRPRYGQYFYVSDLPITFEAVALSVKGDFSNTITWSSNIDGKLAAGKLVEITPSIGEHEITATGSNGVTTGSMTIRINIEKDPDFLKKYK
jgi:hypothetical protein